MPLECARACAEVIDLARRAGELGYRDVISDVGVGVAAAYAALRSAALNVYINAPSLKDRRFAEHALAEVERLAKACWSTPKEPTRAWRKAGELRWRAAKSTSSGHSRR